MQGRFCRGGDLTNTFDKSDPASLYRMAKVMDEERIKLGLIVYGYCDYLKRLDPNIF
jgi:hypothetical protein